MCKAMEDMRTDSLKEVALRMLAAGKLSLAEITEYVGLPLDVVNQLKATQTA